MRWRSIAIPKPHAMMIIHERSESGLRVGAYAYGDLSAATRPIAMRRRKGVWIGESRNWTSNSWWQLLHNTHSWRGSGTPSGSMRGMEWYQVRRSQIEQRVIIRLPDWRGLSLWRATVESPSRLISLTARCPFCTLALSKSPRVRSYISITYYHIFVMNLWYLRGTYNEKERTRSAGYRKHGTRTFDFWLFHLEGEREGRSIGGVNDKSAPTENSFSHLMSGKRYTTVSTKTHTPSTKCQYISPATTAQWLFTVKSPRRERINRTDKKMRPTITCEAWRPVSAKKVEPWSEVDGVKSW